MAQPLETPEIKSCDGTGDDTFWQMLQKSSKMTLNEILNTVRTVDKTMNLTIGKFHDANQTESSGFFSFLKKTDTKKNEMMRDQLCSYTIFPNKKIPLKLKKQWINDITKHNKYIDRAVGCMIGMGIGDACGHPLEFVPITAIAKPNASRPRFDYKKQKYHNEYNKFQLDRGQWTDDAAMGLCLADSLIIHDKYNGSDIRIRFWNWWHNGYNNAFRKDKSRSASCGLGGNISSSIYSCKHGVSPSARFEVKHDREDSGNGSLMRLAAVPIYFHNNTANARKYALESSFTTHPGYIAGEACSFMSYIIVSAIHMDSGQKANKKVKKFMDNVCDKYKEILENETQIIATKMAEIKAKYANKELNEEKKENDGDEVDDLEYKLLQREGDAKKLILRLIASAEPENGLEECWNWKNKYGKLPIIQTFYARSGGKDLDRWNRKKYNGYPVSADYWGSYCMDGLAMGLHCVYHSKSFADSIEKCVNLLGDADSTGSIGGQIAGAFYGFQSITNDKKQFFLFQQLVTWDDYDFAFRGLLLFILGDDKLKQLVTSSL